LSFCQETKWHILEGYQLELYRCKHGLNQIRFYRSTEPRWIGIWAGRHVVRQMDRQTDGQANRLAERHTDKYTDGQTDRQAGC
jgi:hypothetical protein